MKKKIIISTLLILTMLLNVFSIPVFAMEMIGDLEPEKVVLISDSNDFKDSIIKTSNTQSQNVDLKVENDIQSADLDSVTNIIVDQENYMNMSNSDKRDINHTLKDEISNRKKVFFLGDENSLDFIKLSENLDFQTGFEEITPLDEESKVFAVSFEKDIDNGSVISFYRTDNNGMNEEKSLMCLSDIITSSFEEDNKLQNTNCIEPQKLSSTAVKKKTKLVDYNVTYNNKKAAVIRNVIEAQRVGVKNAKKKARKLLGKLNLI